jgi:hypothetical protein
VGVLRKFGGLQRIMRVVRARACARASWGLTRGWRNEACYQIKPIRLAAQAQAPAAMRCEDPSRRQMLGEGRVRESPVPLPWRIVHGSEDRGWSSADCRSPASALARISREAAGGKVRRLSGRRVTHYDRGTLMVRRGIERLSCAILVETGRSQVSTGDLAARIRRRQAV